MSTLRLKPQPGVRTQYVWYPPGIQNLPYHTSSKSGCGFSLSVASRVLIPPGFQLEQQAAQSADAKEAVATQQLRADVAVARPSLIPSLCTHFTRAGIEWRR